MNAALKIPRLTEAKALARATRKFGKVAAVRSYRRKYGVSSAAARDAALNDLRAWRDAKPTLPEIDAWPKDATIGEYIEARRVFRQRFAEWKKREGELMFAARYHAFQILTVGNLFATVRGEGDSWEDALWKAGA